jgi:hypothetical protein
MSSPSSNVRIVSNVYPITTATTDHLPGRPKRTSGVIEDPVFRRQIWCKKSLRILSDLKAGGVIDDRHRVEKLLENRLVERYQIEACWDPDYCVDCSSGERPIGPITKDGRTIVECRCQKPDCPVRQSGKL